MAVHGSPSSESVSKPATWARRLLRAVQVLLLPTFLQYHSSTGSKPLRRTAHLDGLRGLGAWCVVNYHILSGFETFVNYGYGLTPEDGHREPYCAHHNEEFTHNERFHQLPFIRLIYSGSAPVCIFFVLSGFVLSYRAWQILHRGGTSGRPAELYGVIGSSAFRRMTRLFLPPLIVSFVTMLLIAAGAWDYPAEVAADRTIIRAESEFHQPRLAGLGAQLISWGVMVVRMLDYGHWDEYYPPYDVHLWTIPMEYRSSMLLFLMLLITVRLRIHYRMGILAALLGYSYSITRWVAVLFLAGAIIAETVVLCPIREHESADSQECQNGSGREGYQLLPLQETTNTRGAPLPSSSSGAEASTTVTDSRKRRLCRQVFCTITIIVGLYLMSAPDYCISRTPGYRTLAVLIPPHDERDWRFYPSVGAILLVAALAHSPRDGLLVRGLESRLVQYLGRVSYSLYLVHGPAMHGLGYRIFPLIWAIVGREGWRDPMGLALGWLVVFSIVFYIADRVMVAVDEPCVRFGRWVEQRMLAAAE